MSKKYHDFLETGLFYRRTKRLDLIGTNFSFSPFYDCWMNDYSFNIDFEYVLENVSAEIQTQLLFHLDLFG